MSWNPKAQAQRQLAAIAAQGRKAAPNAESLARQTARAEVERQEVLRQVTARLKEGLPGKALAGQHSLFSGKPGQWGSGNLSGAAMQARQQAANVWAKSITAQMAGTSYFSKLVGKRADAIILDDVVSSPDDRVDAMKYALWSTLSSELEGVVKVSST